MSADTPNRSPAVVNRKMIRNGSGSYLNASKNVTS